MLDFLPRTWCEKHQKYHDRAKFVQECRQELDKDNIKKEILMETDVGIVWFELPEGVNLEDIQGIQILPEDFFIDIDEDEEPY